MIAHLLRHASGEAYRRYANASHVDAVAVHGRTFSCVLFRAAVLESAAATTPDVFCPQNDSIGACQDTFSYAFNL
jgi:hypothetical protein